MLGIDGEFQASHPKGTFEVVLENCKKSFAKFSVEKRILLSFVTLSTIFSMIAIHMLKKKKVY